MRSTSFFPVILASSLAIASPARAGVLNGGLETGDFAGWSVAGDALVVTSAIGVAPPEGTFQALLTTASDLGDAHTFSGTDAVPAAALEVFLGLAVGTLGAGFEGSAAWQTIAAAAGDMLTFQYKFLTTEGSRNDFAFVTLAGLGILADTTAADLVASAVVLDPVFGDATRETGWRTFSYTFAAAGTFILGIGVADASDEFIPSGLLVDDVRILPAGPIIPEPPSLLLLGVGGTAVVLLCWHRCRPRSVVEGSRGARPGCDCGPRRVPIGLHRRFGIKAW